MPEQVPPSASLKVKEQDDSKFVTEELGAMNPLIHRLLAGWFIAIGIVSILLLIRVWPVYSSTDRVTAKLDSLSHRLEALAEKRVDTTENVIAAASSSADTTRGGSTGHIDRLERRSERSFFWIALLAGMLGGATHGLNSLLNFRGNRRLFTSWSLWYFGRPILGGMMSMIFFFVLQAGLISNNAPPDVVNPYGVAAISTLVGLFTDVATQKLAEVFKTLFSTKDSREGVLKVEQKSDAKEA